MTAGMKVTPSEYHRLSWLAGHKGTDVSNMLRSLVMEPLMEEHARLTAPDKRVA